MSSTDSKKSKHGKHSEEQPEEEEHISIDCIRSFIADNTNYDSTLPIEAVLDVVKEKMNNETVYKEIIKSRLVNHDCMYRLFVLAERLYEDFPEYGKPDLLDYYDYTKKIFDVPRESIDEHFTEEDDEPTK